MTDSTLEIGGLGIDADSTLIEMVMVMVTTITISSKLGRQRLMDSTLGIG